MNLLPVIPLLPLAAALWLALSSRARQLSATWIVPAVAAISVAVALLAVPARLEIPELLLQDTSALVLDETSRAALLLFGGLWLTAGLLAARRTDHLPAIPMLVALSGATALALADGGPMIYAGMLVTGYGMYAILACEPDEQWRRAGRVLVVFLVLSDLLVFEILLASTKYALPGIQPGLVWLGIIALILRGAIPPAHGWLPRALAASGQPTAVLLLAVPTAAALFGALKVVPGGIPEFGMLCLLLGLAGGVWATLGGLAQARALPTMGYATAATAALLLMALPAGTGDGGQLAWLVVALLASCAALPLLPIQAAGWMRDSAIIAALFAHGLAGGQAAVHAFSALPAWGAAAASLVAIFATVLLTMACRRSVAPVEDHGPADMSRLALIPLGLAVIGIGFAWAGRPPGFASLWIAPAAVTLGLILHRSLPRQERLPPGDLLVVVERVLARTLRRLRLVCIRQLPRLRDATRARLSELWDGQAWSDRTRRIDLRLRAWPATGLMMLALALGMAVLLTR